MEILLGETTLSTPDHYSNPDLPVYRSPVYCESDALDRSITKARLNIVHVACSPSLPPHVQGPVFLQEPPSWLEFSNTTGAMLSCSAHGSPPPDIRWMDAADKELPHIPRLSNIGAPPKHQPPRFHPVIPEKVMVSDGIVYLLQM
uniref:Ig-like domain-containing protein n=1 Tax=Timema douglasi TaxID=61478 RepID=A0A7R8Z531_TIMDO|nr:unnamed protein product [Timema douglasi]